MGIEYGTCGHEITDEEPVYMKSWLDGSPAVSYCILCKRCLNRNKKDLFENREQAMEWLDGQSKLYPMVD